MPWLAEPAFAPRRAPLEDWSLAVSLAEGAGDGIRHLSGEAAVGGERFGAVAIAAIGLPPSACLAPLASILTSSALGGPEARRATDRALAEVRVEPWDANAPHAWLARLPGEPSLIAVRDPLGRVPMFWSRRGDEVILAGDSERIVSEPGSALPSAGAMIGHLSGLWGPPSETYLESIERVPSGHALIASARAHEYRRVWDPVGDDPGSEPLDAGRFRDLFGAAVASALGTDPSAIYLSGGLDSVGVAAIATREAERRGLPAPLALSVGFADSDFDEIATQSAVARSLGISQRLESHADLCGGDPVVTVLELASTMPAPPQNFFLPAFLALGAGAVEEGCAAVLTGTGGDEWLGVTPLLAADLLWRGNVRGLTRLYRTLHRSHPVGRRQAARTIFWRYGLRTMIGAALAGSRRAAAGALLARVGERRARALPTWLAPGEAGRSEVAARLAAAAERRPRRPGSVYADEIRAGLEQQVVSAEAEEFVEHGRRIGAPLRHPFLHPELVETLCAARPEDLTDGSRSKAPLRALVADSLPGLGFESQRKPIAAGYVANLIAGSGIAAYRRLGGPLALAELGVVDRLGADGLVESIRAGSAGPREPYRLWDILCLEAWARPRLR